MLFRSLLLTLLVLVAVHAAPAEDVEDVVERDPRDAVDGEVVEDEDEELSDMDDDEEEEDDMDERSAGKYKLVFHGLLTRLHQVKEYHKHGKTIKVFRAYGGDKQALKNFHDLHLKKMKPWKGKHGHGQKGKFGHYRVHLREGGLYKKPVLSFHRKKTVYRVVYN